MAEGKLRCSGSSLFLKSRSAKHPHTLTPSHPHTLTGTVWVTIWWWSRNRRAIRSMSRRWSPLWLEAVEISLTSELNCRTCCLQIVRTHSRNFSTPLKVCECGVCVCVCGVCVCVCVWNESLFFWSLARKSDLGISGFGISVTTMEEVFIKVGEGTDESLERRYIHTYIHTVHTVHTHIHYIYIIR